MGTGYGNFLEKGSRLKKLLGASAAALVLGVAMASPAWAGASEGRRIEVNYSIDYVLLEGHPQADVPVRIEVFRNATATPDSGVRIGSFEGTTSPDGQGRAGNILEVNHIGGGQFPDGDCWQAPATPDILPGDKVQATILSGPNAGEIDYTFVRNIDFVDEGGRFTGTATGIENADGTFDVDAPITLTAGGEEGVGAIMEGKRVGGNPGDAEAEIFPTNGAFDVPVPGTGGEAFINYLIPNADNTATLEGDEATTAEPRGTVGEASPGCPPLARTAMTDVSHDVINLSNVGQPMTVSGPFQTEPADGITGVDVSLGGKTYAATMGAGTWTATVPAADLGLLGQGNHTITADFAGPAAPANQTRTIRKDTVRPAAPTATPRPGSYDTTQFVTLDAEAGAGIHYTVNGTTPTPTSRLFTSQIAVSASQTIRALAVDGAGNPSANASSFAYTIRSATTTTLNMSTANLKLGNSRAISGRVAPAHAGKVVTMTVRRSGVTVLTRNLRLNASSAYSTSYRPTRPGLYSVSVRFAGDADSKPSLASKSFRTVR